MAGILAHTTWETSGSGGTRAAFGAMARAPSTSPPPSWKPELHPSWQAVLLIHSFPSGRCMVASYFSLRQNTVDGIDDEY